MSQKHYDRTTATNIQTLQPDYAVRGRQWLGILFTMCGMCSLQTGYATPSGDSTHPTSARIVWAHGRVAPEGYPGDVMVGFSDGHQEMWTKRGSCELPRVARTGMVGWTHGVAWHATQGLMNHTVVMVSVAGKIIRLEIGHPFIDQWDFADNDTCVVVRSGNAHGPSRIEKYRLNSRRLLDSCSASHDPAAIPAWARPYADR